MRTVGSYSVQHLVNRPKINELPKSFMRDVGRNAKHQARVGAGNRTSMKGASETSL